MEINSRTNFEYNNDRQKERHYLTNGIQHNQKNDDGNYKSNHLDNTGSRKLASISNKSGATTRNSLNRNDSVVFEHIVPGAVKKMWVMAESGSFEKQQQPEIKDEKRLTSKYGNFFISHDAAKEGNTDMVKKIVDKNANEKSDELSQAKAQWGVKLKPVSSGNKPRPKSVVYDEKLSSNEGSNLKQRSHSLEDLDQVDAKPENYPIKLSVQQRMKNFEKPTSDGDSEKYSYLHTKRPLKPALGNVDLRGKSSIFYQPAESTFNGTGNQMTPANNKGKEAITLKDLLKQDEDNLSVDVVGKRTTSQGQTESSHKNNCNVNSKNSVNENESSEKIATKPIKSIRSTPPKPVIGFEMDDSLSNRIIQRNQKNEIKITETQKDSPTRAPLQTYSNQKSLQSNHDSKINHSSKSISNGQLPIGQSPIAKNFNTITFLNNKKEVLDVKPTSPNKTFTQNQEINKDKSDSGNSKKKIVVERGLKEDKIKEDEINENNKPVLAKQENDTSKTIPSTPILRSKVAEKDDTKIKNELNNNEIKKVETKTIESNVEPLTQKRWFSNDKVTGGDLKPKEAQTIIPKDPVTSTRTNVQAPDEQRDVSRRVGKLIVMTGEERDQQLKELRQLKNKQGMSNKEALENVTVKGKTLTFMSNEVADDNPNDPPAQVPEVVFNSPLPALKSILSPTNKKKKQHVSFDFLFLINKILVQMPRLDILILPFSIEYNFFSIL